MSQGDQDWHNARGGSATGSRFKDILPGKSKKYLKAREDYKFELVAERLTGEPIYKNIGSNGQWGVDIEYYARIAYEAATGFIVRESEFIPHPNIKNAGVSPDGLINTNGGVEIKSRVSIADHLKTFITKEIPEGHIPQVQGSIWVTDREWWDFASYNPYFPEKMRLVIIRIDRDNEYIANLKKEVIKFLSEVDAILKTIPGCN